MSLAPDEPTQLTMGAPALAEVRPSLNLRMSEQGERRLVDITTLKVRANPRKVYATEAIEALAQSVFEVGQIQDCLARLDNAGDVELVCGTRRLRAFALLRDRHPERSEFHKIGVILKAIPEDAIAAIQFVENEERENLTAVETAEHVMTLKNTLKWPDADIATKLGWGNKRIVGMYLSIAEAPPWLKMHAVPVAHEVVKRDKNGEILRSSDGTRQMTTIVGAALGMTHLYELMRFFREAEKYDKRSKSSNSDHAPVAQQLTQRFASKASLEEWSKARLKTALDDQLAKLTGVGPEGGDDAPSGPPIFTVGKTRINIDVSKLGSPLPKPRLVEMKPDLVEVLTKLGFKNVLLGVE